MTENRKKPKLLLFVVQNTPASWLGIKLAEKAVLQALVAHLNRQRNGTEVWPSNPTLAELTGAHVETVVKAKLSLHEKGLIKIRRDSGKQDMCTIQEDEIRRLADPAEKTGGSKKRPPGKSRRDPPEKAGGTPRKKPYRTAKEQPEGNSQPDLSSISCSSNLKVGDGDQQRKLALLGIVTRASDSMRITNREQPTEEENGKRLALGTRGMRERPG